jgi:hypothetical protein
MRRVVELAFRDGLKLREIAAEIGVSQTRAHQLREEAVGRLQKSYQSYSLLPPCATPSPASIDMGKQLASSHCA